MRKLLLTAVIALFFGQAVSAQMMTQKTLIPWDGVYRTTFTVNLAKPTTSPCTLILVGWGDYWPTITDDKGDKWETVGSPQLVGGIWYAQCKGGANAVTLSFGSPSRFYGVLAEHAGWYDADVFAYTTTGNSQTSASATITTTSADLIIGYGWNSTTTTPSLSAGAGYTMEGQAGAFLEDMQQTAPGLVSSSVNYLNDGHGGTWSGWWVQGIVAFKPAIPDFCICGH